MLKFHRSCIFFLHLFKKCIIVQHFNVQKFRNKNKILDMSLLTVKSILRDHSIANQKQVTINISCIKRPLA